MPATTNKQSAQPLYVITYPAGYYALRNQLTGRMIRTAYDTQDHPESFIRDIYKVALAKTFIPAGRMQTAAYVKPGDVIVMAGDTKHAPITVTRVTPLARYGYVSIEGFNARNTTPRLMFRSLMDELPMTLQN